MTPRTADTHVLLSRVLDALNGEIEDTEGGHALIGAVMDQLEAQAAAPDALREALDALLEVAYHSWDCAVGTDAACTCGVWKAREQARAALASAPSEEER